MKKEILKQLKSLLKDESDMIANMANASSLLFYSMEHINWAGFYIYKNNELILGPFQGKPACMHIPMGKGVCGTAAQSKKILRVDNVHEFPGHIACDNASKSEIVIPVILKDTLIGVLDIDSDIFSRFNENDEILLQQFVSIFIDTLI